MRRLFAVIIPVCCAVAVACGSGGGGGSKTPAVNACGAAVTATTASCGGSGATVVSGSPEATGTASAQSLIAPIAQQGMTLGAPGAPLTIDLYQNFLCPHCHDFALGMFTKLITDYVATGRVDVVFHDAALGGGPAEVAHEAARCAADQGKFWPAYFALYENFSDDTSVYTKEHMESVLASTGVDAAELKSCLDADQHLADVQSATSAFQHLADNDPTYANALATVMAEQGPAIPLLDIGGTFITAPEDYASVKAAIDAKLGR